jgi:hypothetical protein
MGIGTGFKVLDFIRRNPPQGEHGAAIRHYDRSRMIPAADAASHSRRGMRPSYASTFAPMRAWGMPGAQCTHSLVREINKAHEHSHHRSTGSIPAFPHANGFNGFLRALPGNRALCHRRLARLLARLDAGVEASGPHDFAVRESIGRLCATCAPNAAASTAFHPNVSDDGQRPP